MNCDKPETCRHIYHRVAGPMSHGKRLYPVAMTSNVTEFIGVYDADSTLIGEVSYWIGARLGRTHCSLCELTHGLFTQKSEWKACAKELSVPFHSILFIGTMRLLMFLLPPMAHSQQSSFVHQTDYLSS